MGTASSGLKRAEIAGSALLSCCDVCDGISNRVKLGFYWLCLVSHWLDCIAFTYLYFIECLFLYCIICLFSFGIWDIRGDKHCIYYIVRLLQRRHRGWVKMTKTFKGSEGKVISSTRLYGLWFIFDVSSVNWICVVLSHPVSLISSIIPLN